MLLRPIRDDEQQLYDSIVQHPLQSWAWGEFRKQTGIQVERVGFFEGGKLINAFQVFFHPIPLLGGTAGYCPKAYMPDEEQIQALRQLGIAHNALFVKLEPNVGHKVDSPSGFDSVDAFLKKNECVVGKSLFTKYTFQLDLTQDEEKLFGNLASKTRYNVNVAKKKDVKIYENTTKEGMDRYIEILQETTSRQGFYAHTPNYFRKMWETIGQSGMIRIFEAHYQDQVLVSWVMFAFNNRLYYPYGASRSVFREVMASTLMMWEMIRFGHLSGNTLFDMWGSLGPTPDEKDPWFGFHRFKKGFGADLVEFLGTYDLVLNPRMYTLFTALEKIRWSFLRFKAKFQR
jgi:lipid II:glycine glycyltransferase (peptidoglycan interpeptide bridge formation enzyme)